jgi:hypothetical protein
VSGLREQLRLGIFGEGPRSAVGTLVLGVAAIVASLFYDALNHGPSVLFLRTPLDDLIPVVGPFVIPYVSLRPFIYLSAVLFLLFRARIYRSAAVSMIVVLAVSYAFYAFLQTYIERPAIAGDDLFARMIRDVYAGDQPFNDFPSLHASLSTICDPLAAGRSPARRTDRAMGSAHRAVDGLREAALRPGCRGRSAARIGHLVVVAPSSGGARQAARSTGVGRGLGFFLGGEPRSEQLRERPGLIERPRRDDDLLERDRIDARGLGRDREEGLLAVGAGDLHQARFLVVPDLTHDGPLE